jgi:SAM-dependent methyltransferase
MGQSMKEVFTKIYSNNKWGRGSGVGSSKYATRTYRRYLQQFIRTHNIRSVVDLGCGDWQFSRFIDWKGVEYHGFDLVEDVIKSNVERFSQNNIKFSIIDDMHNIPEADLLIVKDVMQHWDNKTIIEFIPTIKKYKHALITNALHIKNNDRTDIPVGEFRSVDLNKEPFNQNIKKVLEFEVILLSSQRWNWIFDCVPYVILLQITKLFRGSAIEKKAVYYYC